MAAELEMQELVKILTYEKLVHNGLGKQIKLL